MEESIKSLLLDDSFQTGIIEAIHQPGCPAPLASANSNLQVDADGNIVHINEVPLDEKVSHQLTYLIGSINFLFGVINDELAAGRLPQEKNQQLLDCRKKTITLILDLMTLLLQVKCNEEIIAIMGEIGRRKTELKKETNQ